MRIFGGRGQVVDIFEVPDVVRLCVNSDCGIFAGSMVRRRYTEVDTNANFTSCILQRVSYIHVIGLGSISDIQGTPP